MPRTPDRFHGISHEEGVDFDVSPDGLAAGPGKLRYYNDRFSMYDGVGEFDPRAGGGISDAQHRALRHLIHFIEFGPCDGFGTGPLYSETLPAGSPFPTSEVWYDDNTKAKKIVEWSCTYNSNQTYSTETWAVYDTDGTTKLVEVVDTISYSGVFETSRSRAVTVY